MVTQLQMQRAAHLAQLSQLALLGCVNLHQVGAGCPASLWLHSSPTQTGPLACAATQGLLQGPHHLRSQTAHARHATTSTISNRSTRLSPPWMTGLEPEVACPHSPSQKLAAMEIVSPESRQVQEDPVLWITCTRKANIRTLCQLATTILGASCSIVLQMETRLGGLLTW